MFVYHRRRRRDANLLDDNGIVVIRLMQKLTMEGSLDGWLI
jgi:hypothetical protein